MWLNMRWLVYQAHVSIVGDRRIGKGFVMTIEIQGKYSDVNISVNYNGELVLEFKNDKKVYEALLEAIYTEMNTEDFIATLDYDQMAEISRYFETIKDKR